MRELQSTSATIQATGTDRPQLAGGGAMTQGFPLPGRRVFVAGHRGMVGAAVGRELRARGCEVLTAAWPGLDLRRLNEPDSPVFHKPSFSINQVFLPNIDELSLITIP